MIECKVHYKIYVYKPRRSNSLCRSTTYRSYFISNHHPFVLFPEIGAHRDCVTGSCTGIGTLLSELSWADDLATSSSTWNCATISGVAASLVLRHYIWLCLWLSPSTNEPSLENNFQEFVIPDFYAKIKYSSYAWPMINHSTHTDKSVHR
jgi:hypothetical protein